VASLWKATQNFWPKLNNLEARGQNFNFWINRVPNFNFLLLMPRIWYAYYS
jgi:hypothetical protein